MAKLNTNQKRRKRLRRRRERDKRFLARMKREKCGLITNYRRYLKVFGKPGHMDAQQNEALREYFYSNRGPLTIERHTLDDRRGVCLEENWKENQ